MDEQIPVPIPSPMSSNVKPERKKRLLFQIGFISIVLVTLSIILNYFNTLPVSKLLPNYLGFLPHKPYEQIQDKKNPPVKKPSSFSQINYNPNSFVYDTKKARTIL